MLIGAAADADVELLLLLSAPSEPVSFEFNLPPLIVVEVAFSIIISNNNNNIQTRRVK